MIKENKTKTLDYHLQDIKCDKNLKRPDKFKTHYSLNSSVLPVLDGGEGECHGGAGQVRGEERVHIQLADIFSHRGTSLLPTTSPNTTFADLQSKEYQTKFSNTTTRAEPDQSEWRTPARLNSGTSSPYTVVDSHLKRKEIKKPSKSFMTSDFKK